MTSSPHAMPPAPPEVMPESSNGTNVALVARREYIERVRSRAFLFSTLLLIGLAVVVALIPLGVRLLDRATVTQVGVVADDAALAARAVAVMDSALNAPLPGGDPGAREVRLRAARRTPAATAEEVRNGVLAGAILIVRKPDNGLDFQVLTTGALSPDRAQLLQIGAFGVGILDWTASQPGHEHAVRPAVVQRRRRDGGLARRGSGLAVDTAEYASRRIVGIVFVVLSFLTLVFYGLWVASGVVAEKASRVMELLISAATAPQLVVGKISGIGLAGLTQVTLVLLPAVLALLLSGRLGSVDARHGRQRGAVARRPVAGPPARVPRLLHARASRCTPRCTRGRARC